MYGLCNDDCYEVDERTWDYVDSFFKHTLLGEDRQNLAPTPQAEQKPSIYDFIGPLPLATDEDMKKIINEIDPDELSF